MYCILSGFNLAKMGKVGRIDEDAVNL
jgi:hypothetical protein